MTGLSERFAVHAYGSSTEEAGLGGAANTVGPDVRRAMLRHMIVTRAVDDEAVRLQNQGAVDLWLSCRGQEAAQVASAMAIGEQALIFPSYREHAVAVARGIDGVELVSQWAGRTFCGWNPRERRFFPYTLVVGAQTLHAVGYAIGRRLRDAPEPVAVYFGDGATSEGDVSEAMNLAAVESAPVLFVCQNNGWAISKPSRDQMRTSIAARATGFGITSWSVDATDPDSTYLNCVEAWRHVEDTGSPALIELRTTRTAGHSSSDAHTLYRDRDEIAEAAANDQVAHYREMLRSEGLVDEAWLQRADAEAHAAEVRLVEALAR